MLPEAHRGEPTVTRRHLFTLGVAATAIALAAVPSTPALAGGSPPVRVVTVAELDQPVGFTFAPSGRIVYLERATGEVRSLDLRTGRDRLWYRISGVNRGAWRARDRAASALAAEAMDLCLRLTHAR